jgi:hypothetical protein
MEVGVESVHEELGFFINRLNPSTACINGSVVSGCLLVSSAVLVCLDNLPSS